MPRSKVGSTHGLSQQRVDEARADMTPLTPAGAGAFKRRVFKLQQNQYERDRVAEILGYPDLTEAERAVFLGMQAWLQTHKFTILSKKQWKWLRNVLRHGLPCEVCGARPAYYAGGRRGWCKQHEAAWNAEGRRYHLEFREVERAARDRGREQTEYERREHQHNDLRRIRRLNKQR